MEEIEAGGEYINNMLEKMAKEQSKVIDDIIFNFLKQNGYRPRRTEKYVRNLTKKLAKQGKNIKLDEVILEEKYDNFSYYKKVTYIPKFIDIGGM